MIRVSDGPMSGTTFGPAILHVSPVSQASGPPARVNSRDCTRISAAQGVQELLVDEAEQAQRRPAWMPDASHCTRGSAQLYVDTGLQADQGADLEFLAGKNTRPAIRESH